MSAQGVFTPEIRVEPVRGWLTGGVDPGDGSVECGEGTAYPMEATLDQIAEIFYRVKDAKFISGFLEKGTGDDLTPGFFTYFRVYPPTDAPTQRAYVQNFTGLAGDYHLRGYQTSVGSAPVEVSAHNSPYLGDEYDPGDGEMRRDISGNERGMWLSSEDGTVLPNWDGATGVVVNAFSFFSNNYSESAEESDPFLVSGGVYSIVPDGFGGSIESRLDGEISLFQVVFNGKIAVVRVNPTDALTAPTNRFFLGLSFDAVGPTVGYGLDTAFSTNIANLTDEGVGLGFAVACNYNIRLSGGVELSCPIYASVAYETGGDDLISGEDITHEATEWWPYNRLAEPVQMWDSATGEKIPAGAPFLAFDLDANLDQIFNLI